MKKENDQNKAGLTGVIPKQDGICLMKLQSHNDSAVCTCYDTNGMCQPVQKPECITWCITQKFTRIFVTGDTENLNSADNFWHVYMQTLTRM